MQAVKRKRVTQVGSGAYAIYLPKKWIDGWTQQQRDGREVDLHLINNSLLIVPALRRRSFAGAVRPELDHVRTMLLSCYVQGYHEVLLRPTRGEFDDACVAMARDLLRHLDERLLTTVRPAEIGFSLHEDAPPAFATGGDLLRLMTMKLREMTGLAAEGVEALATRPDRAVHVAQLLHALQGEDLARLYHQALRLVANLELPLTTVSEFQLLDLVAAELEAVGRQCVEVAHAVVAGYGIARDELDRPRSELAARTRDPPEVPPVVHAILRVYGRSFDDAKSILLRLDAALQANDADALIDLVAAARQADLDLNRRLFATVRDAVSDGRPLPPVAYTAYQVRQAAGGLLSGLGRAAERAATLSAAKEAEPGAAGR